MATKQKTHEDLLNDLQCDITTASQAVRDFEAMLRKRHHDDFIAAGGCAKCGGRGWVVTWDTLDSMSGCYAEYGNCPDCDGKGPLDRSYYDKYDGIRGTPNLPLVNTPAEQAEMNALLDAALNAQTAYDSLKLAIDPCVKGKRVRVYKGRKVPIGTEGTVFWIGQQSVKAGWQMVSVTRLGIRADDGAVHWANANNCEAILKTF